MKHFKFSLTNTNQALKALKFNWMLFFSAVFAIAFVLWTSALLENELSPFDRIIYYHIKVIISPQLTVCMKIFSDLCSGYTLTAILAFGAIFSIKKSLDLIYVKMMTVNLLVVTLIDFLFKMFFHRARPDFLMLIQAEGYSFPSGHSMTGAAFYGFLIYLSMIFCKRPWNLLLVIFLSILIILIGVSRIYLGVHYASDVIGGFFAGFAWLTILLFITNRKKSLKTGQLK